MGFLIVELAGCFQIVKKKRKKRNRRDMLLSQLCFEHYTYTRHDVEKGMESKRCCMLYPYWHHFKAGYMSIFPCLYIPHLLAIDLWFGEFVHQLLVLFPIRTGDLEALCNACVSDTSQSSNRLENLKHQECQSIYFLYHSSYMDLQQDQSGSCLH